MNYEKKVKINNMISRIKNKQLLKDLFMLVHVELNSTGECKYTHNNNGIFFDLNILSDETIYQIEKLILDANCLDTPTDSDTIKLNIYSMDDTSELIKLGNGFKLSNKEKNLIANFQKE
jgi:hypothetical protein